MNLKPEEKDALTELINIGAGKAAGVLSDMLQCHISLQVPSIQIMTRNELRAEMEGLSRDRVSAVKLGFKGPFTGTAALVFPPDSASKLVSVLVSEESETADLDAIRVGTLSEVGNIVINGVMGSISNVLKQHISYSLPAYMEDNIVNLLQTEDDRADVTVLLAHTRFRVEKFYIEGDIILIFEAGSFGTLISVIDRDLYS